MVISAVLSEHKRTFRHGAHGLQLGFVQPLSTSAEGKLKKFKFKKNLNNTFDFLKRVI